MNRASLLVLLALPSLAHAETLRAPMHLAPGAFAVVGTSSPAPSLTAARVATLPASEQAPWLAYLKRSAGQLSFDQDELFQERATLSTPVPPPPKPGNSAHSLPLDRDRAFYGSAEARRIAATVVSFQLPNGGWSKNLDLSGPPRLRGQSFMANNESKFLSADDFDRPANPDWNYGGTLDNDATNTELRFLAKVSAAAPGAEGESFRAAFVRGVYYLLAAQFPNGGWPQVWPLEGGYHDAITFNDNAVTESTALLNDAAEGQGEYAFVPVAVRAEARQAAARALACILATQVVVDGRTTVWAQQHDALSLEPVAGRNFEPAALSAGESADVLLFLMTLPDPSARVRASVEAGVRWLREHAIEGMVWSGGRGDPLGRHLSSSPGAAPLWARYTALSGPAAGKPIFGDRDKSIHDDVRELSAERRNGYAWYSTGPQAALVAYTRWKARAKQ